MSTRRLSRTIIERGRAHFNKIERRRSHTTERNSVRDMCNLLVQDSDLALSDKFLIAKKEVVRKEFNDNISPMFGWLRSRCGQPWNDVHSEICKIFDTRTTAGRHIVYDHLLSSVEEVPDLRYRGYNSPPLSKTTSYYKNDFYVDDVGLLQQKKYITRSNRGFIKIPKFDTKRIINWLSCRVVGQIGNKFFWFIPSDSTKKYGSVHRKWKIEWNNNYHSYSYQDTNKLRFLYSYNKPIHSIDKITGLYNKDDNGKHIVLGYKQEWIDSHPNFRQGRKLSDKEIVFWNSLPEFYKNEILKLSPMYSHL